MLTNYLQTDKNSQTSLFTHVGEYRLSVFQSKMSINELDDVCQDFCPLLVTMYIIDEVIQF
jgi:hypothetical protein